MRGLCKYESLKDGSLDLIDIALLNDALACKFDNEALAKRLMEKNNGTS